MTQQELIAKTNLIIGNEKIVAMLEAQLVAAEEVLNKAANEPYYKVGIIQAAHEVQAASYALEAVKEKIERDKEGNEPNPYMEPFVKNRIRKDGQGNPFLMKEEVKTLIDDAFKTPPVIPTFGESMQNMANTIASAPKLRMSEETRLHKVSESMKTESPERTLEYSYVTFKTKKGIVLAVGNFKTSSAKEGAYINPSYTIITSYDGNYDFKWRNENIIHRSNLLACPGYEYVGVSDQITEDQWQDIIASNGMGCYDNHAGNETDKYTLLTARDSGLALLKSQKSIRVPVLVFFKPNEK